LQYEGEKTKEAPKNKREINGSLGSRVLLATAALVPDKTLTMALNDASSAASIRHPLH
jgi:hypothetical protein